MTALTTRNRISVAEICFYAPTLIYAVYLTVRHGLGRNAAWVYLGVFSVVRLIGAALELATIEYPLNIDIRIAGMIFQNIGISPLMLIVMGLIGRSLATARRSRPTVIRPIELRLIQLLIFLGLILVVVGGVKAGDKFKKTFQFHLPKEGEAGLSLIIAGFGLLVLAALYVSTMLSSIAAGERRLMLAVWLSFPFLVVRVVYGAMGTYTKNPKFNQLTGDAYIFLGMAVLMEIFVAVVCMAIGSTMPATPFAEQAAEFRRLKQSLRRKGPQQEPDTQLDVASKSEGSDEKESTAV